MICRSSASASESKSMADVASLPSLDYPSLYSLISIKILASQVRVVLVIKECLIYKEQGRESINLFRLSYRLFPSYY